MARRRPEVRREEILAATVAVIEHRGFAHTRVTDVADLLGISPALVFYHFESKEALLARAFEYAAERDLERLHVALVKGSDATDRLRRILRLYGPQGAAGGWLLWIDAWATALRVPELRHTSGRLDRRWKQAVAEVIADGVRRGEFRCDDPSGAAWRITALIDGLAVQTTVHGAVTHRQVAAWVDRVVRAELHPQKGTFMQGVGW
ncbi:MAG TPA: TetR/AcrR family transcriptional regulator [Actinomycetes bacterium]